MTDTGKDITHSGDSFSIDRPLRIVMIDSHSAIERGGEGLTSAVHKALAPVRRHRSALQRGARKAQYASRNLIDSQGS
jgi:hypothetical protein